jgi:septum site-determining protein MinC
MSIVNIKGYNNNLVFVFGEEGSCPEYLSYLNEKFSSNNQVFKGSQVIFRGEGLKKLLSEEIASLQRLCLDHGMILNNAAETSKPNRTRPQIDPGSDLIIRRTLRSGQKIHSEGSVIVWGDVHESAEIVAAGDIVVLGKLRGIAHAGCYGDLTSTVFALTLAPSQIRIGDKISRSSENSVINPYPEIAYVEGDNIYIKEYHPRDNLSAK